MTSDSQAGKTEDGFEHALQAWNPAVRLGEHLGGGNRNDVREVRINGTRYAARWSPRPAIAWELDLLGFLARHGLRVPSPVPTAGGDLQHGGLAIFTWLDGDPPATDDDWEQVAIYLTHLHALTTGWPQRPSFLGTRDFLNETTGGDVDLSLMPAEAVSRCRDAWRTLATAPRAVIHGDPSPGNIRMTRAGAGFLDWDESRVDATWLDLASLPINASTISPPSQLEAIRRAALAWEAANGWTIEPDYARRCLAELSDRVMHEANPGPESSRAD